MLYFVKGPINGTLRKITNKPEDFDFTFMSNIKIVKKLLAFFFSHKKLLNLFPKSIHLDIR